LSGSGFSGFKDCHDVIKPRRGDRMIAKSIPGRIKPRRGDIINLRVLGVHFIDFAV
jgi:hypothetical protein